MRIQKIFQKSLFIFRRDLRLDDNTGLIFALKSSETVIPAFIFTPEQIEKNPFRSDHCLKFMIESLQDLKRQLKRREAKLFLFEGEPQKIVDACITELKIDACFVNRDYTPYSLQRDQTLEKTCKDHDVSFFSCNDALLHPPEETLKKDGKPYTIFTPWFRNASKNEILPPVLNTKTNYFHGTIPFAKDRSILSKIIPKHIRNSLAGGRTEGLKILKKISSFSKYESLRDFPAEDYSTHLSPYLKFTVCSPREVYHAIFHHLGAHHALVRSLYWRDFFTGIAFFFPYVLGKAFRPEFDKLKWSYDQKSFQRWCHGHTGFPLVDAGMREMNETGFMQTRVRMVAGSFLVKDLHIDWRWGEQYFARTLIDYDPAVNNGNWQWVASTGCDAQAPFRIFNPWNQQKKFDPHCQYIKKWVPELANLSPKIIHAWHEEKFHAVCPQYPAPMTDHAQSAKKTLLAYRSIK